MLSKTERELLQLRADGFNYREIAKKRCRSVKTVETHFTHMLKKTGLHSVYEVLACGFRQGWIK